MSSNTVFSAAFHSIIAYLIGIVNSPILLKTELFTLSAPVIAALVLTVFPYRYPFPSSKGEPSASAWVNFLAEQ